MQGFGPHHLCVQKLSALSWHISMYSMSSTSGTDSKKYRAMSASHGAGVMTAYRFSTLRAHLRIPPFEGCFAKRTCFFCFFTIHRFFPISIKNEKNGCLRTTLEPNAILQ